MRENPDDYAAARKLLASTFAAIPADSWHHDHDEEFAFLSFCDPPLSSKPRSLAYWLETGSLVREYLMLRAGAGYNETLRQGFVAWLRNSPGEHRQYVDGDDMTRAALVDWFLSVVR